jgi:hypothetical protein
LIIHKGQKCGVSRLHAVLVFPFSLSPARPFSASKQILNGKRRNLKKI